MEQALQQQQEQVAAISAELQKLLQERQQEQADRQQEKQMLLQRIEELSSAAATPVGAPPQFLAGSGKELGKPDMFHGERDKYADWSFVMKAYMMSADGRYQDIFTHVEASEVALPNAVLSAAERDLSTKLYFALVMLCRDKAQDKMSKIPHGKGFEAWAWRQFTLDYDPKIKTRRVGLLMNILTTKFSGDLSQAIDKFETMTREYEQHSKKTLDDELKAGLAVVNMQDEEIQRHLIRNSHRLDTWDRMRDELLELTRTSQYINKLEPVPMEIGALPGKGKKGKDKGKGKAKGNGKGKDKDTTGDKSETKVEKKCFYCGQPGHVWADCWWRMAGEEAQKEAEDATHVAAAAWAVPSGWTQASWDWSAPGCYGWDATDAQAQAQEHKPCTALQFPEMELHDRVPKGFLL